MYQQTQFICNDSLTTPCQILTCLLLLQLFVFVMLHLGSGPLGDSHRLCTAMWPRSPFGSQDGLGDREDVLIMDPSVVSWQLGGKLDLHSTIYEAQEVIGRITPMIYTWSGALDRNLGAFHPTPFERLGGRASCR